MPPFPPRLAAVAMLAAMPASASAQSIDFGQALFAQNCAACHGAEGAGDGPVAAHLDPKPADLRGLAARNDGTYPFGEVWNAIQTGSLSAHGSSDMPVWGDLFLEEALPREVHPGVSASDLVEARMLALTYFLQSIQQ